MSRTFPGGTDVTSYLETAASAVFNFATNVCWWAMIKPDISAGTGVRIIAHAGLGDRGVAAYHNDTLDVLVVSKEGSTAAVGTATTGFPAGAEWYAVQLQTTHLGNGHFKRWRYSNTTLTSEDITNSATLTAPTTNHLVVGQYGGGISSNFSFAGLINRVVLLQADPSDAQFQEWAESGTIPSALTASVKFHAILTNESPIPELSGTGLTLTVNGTLPFSSDEPTFTSGGPQIPVIMGHRRTQGMS